MAKITMSPADLLRWIRLGIVNGNYSAAIAIIDEALEQFPASDIKPEGGPSEK